MLYIPCIDEHFNIRNEDVLNVVVEGLLMLNKLNKFENIAGIDVSAKVLYMSWLVKETKPNRKNKRAGYLRRNK